MAGPEGIAEIIRQELTDSVRPGQQCATKTYSAVIEFALDAKRNLFGEYDLVWNPRTGVYEKGIKRAGWFHYRRSVRNFRGVR